MAHFITMFDAKVLVCAHLQGKDVTVTIESVKPGKIVGEGGRSDKMPIVKFAGKDLPLGLNKTNCRTIAAMYGPEVQAWIGKRVTLFPTTCKGKEGNVVDCIRVRPVIPGERVQSAPADAPPNPDDDGR